MHHALTLAVVTSFLLLDPTQMFGATAQRHDARWQEEYAQARNIAMKDSQVRAAFARANEKLEQRIYEIDPSLRPKPAPVKVARPMAKPEPAPVHRSIYRNAEPAPARTHSLKYIVVKGDTLNAIAMRFRVGVPRLMAANNITNERSLRIGQKLTIPPTKSAESQAVEPGNFWTKLKQGL